MKARTSLFSLLLLTALSGVAAQSLPRGAEPQTVRPLNLSVRKQSAPTIDPALLLMGQPAPVASQSPGAGISGNEDAGTVSSLPYGAGFESRQQGGSNGNGNAGSAGGSGSSGSGAGSGGGGRGGSGRGR